MKALVEELLLLARLDEAREPAHEAVDLTVLAADACSDAAAVAPSRRLVLDVPDPVVVLGDEPHLRQAIANLVTNALHHTPDGTPVEVHTAVDDGMAEVVVRDHGPGSIPTRWSTRSTGCGAAIPRASGAARASASRSSPRSRRSTVARASVVNAPDGGACFTLRLPLNPNAPVPEAAG